LTVVFPKVLAPVVGDQNRIEVEAATIAEAIESVLEWKPGLAVHLFGEGGELRPHVLCFVDGRATRLEDRTVALEPDSELRFLQAVSGGQGVFDSPSHPQSLVFDSMTHDITVRKPRSALLRGVYLVLGLVCLGFAYLSFLPGIPTFDFVVLAAFFFARSSDRFHDWLMNHKIFGKMINGYRGGLTLRVKIAATLGILTSLSISAGFLTGSSFVRTVIALVGVYAVWFVWSRPRKDSVAIPVTAKL